MKTITKIIYLLIVSIALLLTTCGASMFHDTLDSKKYKEYKYESNDVTAKLEREMSDLYRDRFGSVLDDYSKEEINRIEDTIRRSSGDSTVSVSGSDGTRVVLLEMIPQLFCNEEYSPLESTRVFCGNHSQFAGEEKYWLGTDTVQDIFSTRKSAEGTQLSWGFDDRCKEFLWKGIRYLKVSPYSLVGAWQYQSSAGKLIEIAPHEKTNKTYYAIGFAASPNIYGSWSEFLNPLGMYFKDHLENLDGEYNDIDWSMNGSSSLIEKRVREFDGDTGVKYIKFLLSKNADKEIQAKRICFSVYINYEKHMLQ